MFLLIVCVFALQISNLFGDVQQACTTNVAPNPGTELQFRNSGQVQQALVWTATNHTLDGTTQQLSSSIGVQTDSACSDPEAERTTNKSLQHVTENFLRGSVRPVARNGDDNKFLNSVPLCDSQTCGDADGDVADSHPAESGGVLGDSGTLNGTKDNEQDEQEEISGILVYGMFYSNDDSLITEDHFPWAVALLLTSFTVLVFLFLMCDVANWFSPNTTIMQPQHFQYPAQPYPVHSTTQGAVGPPVIDPSSYFGMGYESYGGQSQFK